MTRQDLALMLKPAVRVGQLKRRVDRLERRLAELDRQWPRIIRTYGTRVR